MCWAWSRRQTTCSATRRRAERDELIWLEYGEERRYDVTFRVLAGKDDIAAAEKRITGIARQPAEDFPEPSNNHVPLAGRAARKGKGAV